MRGVFLLAVELKYPETTFRQNRSSKFTQHAQLKPQGPWRCNLPPSPLSSSPDGNHNRTPASLLTPPRVPSLGGSPDPCSTHRLATRRTQYSSPLLCPLSSSPQNEGNHNRTPASLLTAPRVPSSGGSPCSTHRLATRWTLYFSPRLLLCFPDLLCPVAPE